MPADYDSTARALALPLSPPHSPNVSHQSRQPPWSRRRKSLSVSRSLSSSNQGDTTLRDKIINTMERLGRETLKRLTPLQMVLAGIVGIIVIAVTILFLVFNDKIFAWLEPKAQSWKDLRGGWCILWAMTFITAFPPVIGYSSCLTIAGFVYGFPEGWIIVASATVIGSTCSFVASRTVLSGYVRRLVEHDRRFEALSLVLKHDGLKLLCMIRLCPLPYSLSNGAISTFPTVQPALFALATAIATPKLMIAIFIGTRLKAIAKSGEKMDASTKAINWISIIGGLVLGVATGWLIYKRTVARSRQLEVEERAGLRNSASRNVDFADSPDRAATATLLRDDQLDFHDNDTTDQGQYLDEFTDDEDTNFAFGGSDEEETIGLDRQPPRR